MLRRSWQQQFGTALALVYLAGAFWWSLPAGLPFKEEVVRTYSPVFQYLALFQDWSMFSPNPRSEDIYTSSRIHFASGRIHTINLSNMAEMDYGERYRKERWRKFLNDYVRTDAHSFLWEPFAQWLMRTMEAESGQQVTKVELYRHWLPAKAPGQPFDTAWRQYKFYEISKEG